MNARKNSQETAIWPHNLLFEISADKARVQGPITKDQMRGLGFLLSILTERERTVLLRRYKEHKAIKTIAYDSRKPVVWAERALDKGLAKLRRPECQVFYNQGYSAAIRILELEAESDRLAAREAELVAREAKLLANEAVLGSLGNFMTKAEEVRSLMSSLRSGEDKLDEAMAELRMALVGAGATVESNNDRLMGIAMAQYESVPISKLGLSTRINNRLRWNGKIHTIGELGKSSKRDLLNVHNLGKTSVQQIADAFKAYTGYTLPEY